MISNLAHFILEDHQHGIKIKIPSQIKQPLQYIRYYFFFKLFSAIRETGLIEKYADALVDLLETCLNYNLRPLNGGPDPPHAKIASDIMSRIFLSYSKKNVMKLALPVSVKFLHKGQKESKACLLLGNIQQLKNVYKKSKLG